MEVIPQTCGRGGVVVGYSAAGSDAAVAGHSAEHEVEGGAADVVEVDFDERVRGGFQVGFEIGAFVVEAGVGSESLAHPFAFGVAAGYADYFLAADDFLGDLYRHASHGACGARYDDCVVGGRAGDLLEPVICR